MMTDSREGPSANPIRIRDLDSYRPDWEWCMLTAATTCLFCSGNFFYLGIDLHRVTRHWVTWPLFWATALLITGLLSVRSYVRSQSQAWVLAINPGARTYEVSQGLFRRERLWSGSFDDFTDVRLERTVRRVWFQRNVRRADFWTVSLAWGDPARRSVCLQEFQGAVIEPSPPKWLAVGDNGAPYQGRAALDRWARDLGLPARDLT